MEHRACVECSVDKALQTVESQQQPMSGGEDDLTISELQQQLEAIHCEMDRRTERAANYKRMYSDMRRKCAELTVQLDKQLQVDRHPSFAISDYCARQLYRQVLLRAGISYGNSVRPSVRHDPVRIQGQVR